MEHDFLQFLSILEKFVPKLQLKGLQISLRQISVKFPGDLSSLEGPPNSQILMKAFFLWGGEGYACPCHSREEKGRSFS